MFEYKIPQEIKVEFTKEFMTYFLARLAIVFDLEDSMLDAEHLFNLEGTCGWVVEFKNACQKYNLEYIFVYYDQLEWYDSDLFDDELGNLLVDYGLIRGF